jgi:hypothetical protein
MKLCLIGSTRFMEEYRRMNKELTLAGHVVYTVATISTSAAGEHVKAEEQITEERKIILDLVHLRKIQESDAVVLVTDSTGYYGFSTRREIAWARLLGKGLYAPANVVDHGRSDTLAGSAWAYADGLIHYGPLAGV